MDQSGPIAHPVPALSAGGTGLPIYPEFSAGPFAYRVAIYTSPELRALYSMAGAEDLPALFDATPPAAILTGFDPVLEAPFEDYARAHGYTLTEMPKISDRYGSARLWLPAPAAASPTTRQERDNEDDSACRRIGLSIGRRPWQFQSPWSRSGAARSSPA